MRCLAIVFVLVSGCTAAPVLTVQDRAGLGAYMAYEALTAAPPAPPAPKPSPDNPDDGDEACGECGGSGKLGDGTVFVKCTACNGTGKKQDKPAPPPPPAPPEITPAPAIPVVERYAVPPKGDPRTFRRVCRNGSCAWEPIP